MKFRIILGTELLKLRRSWFLAGISIVYCLIPFMLGLFMLMLKDPELAQNLGLLGQKAQIRGGSADWNTFIRSYKEMLGVGGMVILGLIVSWVFAREDADRCAKNLWASGVSRVQVVFAKLLVSSLVFIAINIAVAGISLGVGMLCGLSGFAAQAITDAGIRAGLAVLLALLLAPATAWIALRGRGYLAPLGFTILTIVLGTIFGMTGWGVWFPWTIVPQFAGAGGGADLAVISWIALVIAAGGGILMAIRQAFADCHQ